MKAGRNAVDVDRLHIGDVMTIGEQKVGVVIAIKGDEFVVYFFNEVPDGFIYTYEESRQ